MTPSGVERGGRSTITALTSATAMTINAYQSLAAQWQSNQWKRKCPAPRSYSARYRRIHREFLAAASAPGKTRSFRFQFDVGSASVTLTRHQTWIGWAGSGSASLDRLESCSTVESRATAFHPRIAASDPFAGHGRSALMWFPSEAWVRADCLVGSVTGSRAVLSTTLQRKWRRSMPLLSPAFTLNWGGAEPTLTSVQWSSYSQLWWLKWAARHANIWTADCFFSNHRNVMTINSQTDLANFHCAFNCEQKTSKVLLYSLLL